jgi:hypothetical protein
MPTVRDELVRGRLHGVLERPLRREEVVGAGSHVRPVASPGRTVHPGSGIAFT